MISHPGSFASRSPLRTATLPGITSLRHFTFGSTSVLMYSEMLVLENLPAAQDVSTESPPASLITRLSGTPERSSSPETTKYVRAKSTVVTTREFSSAPLSGVDTRLYFHRFLWVSIIRSDEDQTVEVPLHMSSVP